MSRFFISTSFFLGMFLTGISQESKPIDLQPKDTTVKTQRYGIRVGIDLSRPVRTFLDDNYQGFELVGDYRLRQRLYLAAELGNEERTREEEIDGSVLYQYTTNGSYIKVGAEHNTYENWFGMDNQITIGGRYAFSTFSHTLDNFSFFSSDRFFSPAGFDIGSEEAIEFSNLNASWLELVLAIKAELFANIYLGVSVRLAHLVSNKDPENFRNLWIPGFNKVTENSRWGVGFNYSISYFLPLYKKSKKKKKELFDSNNPSKK